MDKKVFSFGDQNKIGGVGEKLFLKYYESRNASKADGIVYDLTVDDGKTVELKTDTYLMTATPNFFMEQYSSVENQSLGGPWRALKDNVDYFVYFFLQDKAFFWFSPKSLVEFLDGYIIGKQPKTIRNRSWITLGYAVPRHLCFNLYNVNIFE